MPEADTQPLMKKGTEANRRTELKQKMIDDIVIVYLRFGNYLRVKHVKHGEKKVNIEQFIFALIIYAKLHLNSTVFTVLVVFRWA